MSLIKNIYLKKKSFVLDIPEVQLSEKGITLLSGPSGSGKSLFMQVLMGLELPKNKWSWIFEGQNLANMKPPDRRLGVVFQNLELFPHLTARDNILFHAKARKIQSDVYNKKLQTFLEIAKIQHRLDHKISELSGGERQRVAILRALIGEPRILLLDEPFSSLDEALKKDLRIFLKELIENENIPCLLVSHDLRDREIASKVLYIENGKISS